MTLLFMTPIIQALSNYGTTALCLLVLCFSLIALISERFYYSTILHPSTIYAGRQRYRLLSAGLIHSSFQNLLINLVLLWIYGSRFEDALDPKTYYSHLQILLTFLLSIVSSNIISTIIHRNEFQVSSDGSSAGVLGIMVSYLLFAPSETLMNLPAIGGVSNWLVVIFYIGGTVYLAIKRSKDKISHELHLFGALSGVFLTIAFNTDLFY
jgi:membrane associated rhomboid family serine protease